MPGSWGGIRFLLVSKFCLVVSPCRSMRNSPVWLWPWGVWGWLEAWRAWPSRPHHRETFPYPAREPCSSTGANYGQAQWKSYLVIVCLVFWGDVRKLKVKAGPVVLLTATFCDVHPASVGSAATGDWFIICTQILIYLPEQKLAMLLVSS